MQSGGPKAAQGGDSLVERRMRRIVNARSVTVGLALTFVGLALIGAILIRFADQDNFPSFGLAVWWALQTVTTVGYGDVVPTTTVGRIVGGFEMVLGISFIAFLTAGVTSTVIQRGDAQAQEDDRAHRERNTQTIVDGLTETRQAISQLEQRLDQIESKLTKPN
jgi:voltage-gated potassium channel